MGYKSVTEKNTAAASVATIVADVNGLRKRSPTVIKGSSAISARYAETRELMATLEEISRELCTMIHNEPLG